MQRTMSQVIDLYMKSPEWLRLAPRTRTLYDLAFGKAVEFHDRDVHTIGIADMYRLADNLYANGATCRIVISALRSLFSFACSREYMTINPAAGVKDLPEPKPIPRWSDEDIETFIAKTPKHMALVVMMAFYTGQRRSDLIRMEWDDYDGQFIHLVQKKTGKELTIAVHPRLKQALDATRRRSKTILTNAHGERWQNIAISQSVARHARRLGLSSTAIHGIRKSTASHLAEKGATPHQIAAVTGQSLKLVAHYTREADQKKLSAQAVNVWE